MCAPTFYEEISNIWVANYNFVFHSHTFAAVVWVSFVYSVNTTTYIGAISNCCHFVVGVVFFSLLFVKEEIILMHYSKSCYSGQTG